MTDEQALYVTLLVLYLLECTAWVPRGSAGFVGSVGSAGFVGSAGSAGSAGSVGSVGSAGSAGSGAERMRLVFPRRAVSNNKGGLVLGPLLPGVGGVFVVPQWPISIAPGGVLAWVAESLEREERAYQTGAFFPYKALSRVHADGRDVTAGSEVLVTAASASLARAVAGAVVRVRDLPPEARAAGIEAILAAQMDSSAVRARVDAFSRATEALRWSSFALAVLCFVALPAAVVAFGLERIWPVVLAAAYAGAWITAALFFRAHRRLLPESRLERIGQTVLLALLPVSAMRAADSIARTAIQGFHPLAVAVALVPAEAQRRFAEHLIRDARHPRRPVCVSEDPEAQAVEAWYREALQRRIDAIAQRAGVDPQQALAPPAPEEGSRSFCPRCLSQFAETTAIEACADCGGVPVVKMGRT